MGFTKPYLPDVDPDTFLKKPLMERMRILAVEWAENGFGAPRMVHTIYIVKLISLRDRRHHRRDGDIGSARVLACHRMVEPTDRLPEGHPVDRATGVHRRRRIVGSAGRQVQADDRRHPVLGPTGNDPAAPVEVGAVHRRRPAHLVRRRGVPGAAGEPGRRAAVTRRAQRLALKGAAAQHIRPGEPGPAGRADRAAGADRPAGQDDLPGRPQRAVPAGAGLLHRAAVREHDHRFEDGDRGGVGRRRLLEVR